MNGYTLTSLLCFLAFGYVFYSMRKKGGLATALAMSMSSVSVVSNALRLRRARL